MADADLWSILMGSEPDAQERTRAMADALRGQKQQAMAQDALASLSQGTGNKRLMAYGNALAGNAQHEMADATGQGEQLKQMLENRRQRDIQQQQLDQSKYTMSGFPGIGAYKMDTKTGKTTLIGTPDPTLMGGRGGAAGFKLDKAMKDFLMDMDPYKGRQGAFGQDAGLLTAADKVKKLIEGPNGPNYHLTVNQVPELVQAVGAMVANGGHAAEGQLHRLMPRSWGTSVAEGLQYLSSHPEDAGLADFVKQYAETADRETAGAKARIRATQLKHMPFHPELYRNAPAEIKSAARQFLPDLSDEQLDQAFQGTYQDAQRGPAGGGSGMVTIRLKGKPETAKPVTVEQAKRFLADPGFEAVPNG